MLRKGDILYVHSLDRLGRNEDAILKEWNEITQEIRADIIIIDMPLLDTTKYKDSVGTFVADLVLQILSWIAEEERKKMRTRQAEGIANARKQGKELGRPKVTDEQAHAVTKLVENSFAGRERKTLEEIAEKLGISRTTLWTWSNDVNFIRYKEALADQLLRDN